MDNLEGGLDYLREVILDDSLGIAQELEQEMARVVETYQCEWQTTLNDPNHLALFRTAVNGPAAEESKRWQEICGLDGSRSRRGSAPGWGVSRSRCSVLANRSMPLTIRSAAMRTYCHAVFLAMRRVSRWSSRRSTNSVFACATAAVDNGEPAVRAAGENRKRQGVGGERRVAGQCGGIMNETRTTCPYCGVGCGVVARVEGDKVTVRGDDAIPPVLDGCASKARR